METAVSDEKKYEQIELCYKVLGLSLSDPPEKIDQQYRSLLDQYNRQLKIGDPGSRQEAKANLEQVEELYATITGSLIYKDYAREYAKYKELKEHTQKERHQKSEEQKKVQLNCPYCGKILAASVKTCPYCHQKYRSPTEMLLMEIFSVRNIVIFLVLVVLIGAGIFLMKNPQLLQSFR